MNGFNPNASIGAGSETSVRDRETEDREVSIEDKVKALSPLERQELVQEALAQQEELTALIGVVNRVTMDESQDALFE